MAAMRWIVVGAGAVGGVVGGLLADAGEDVTLIARGRHLDAMRCKGLRVRTPAIDAIVRCHVAGASCSVRGAGCHVLSAVLSAECRRLKAEG